VIQDAKGPLFIATPAATRLDDVATQAFWGAPDDIARLGFAVAQALDGAAPAVPGLYAELEPLVQQIAQALQGAKRPLIVSGASLGNEAIIQAAANIAWALHRPERSASLSYAVRDCNSLGVGLFNAQGLEAALQMVTRGSAETIIVLENDLYAQADVALVDALLASTRQVIVLDHLQNGMTSRATLVLPAATFADGDGTLVNNEGRAQRFYQVFPAAGEVQESWRWLADVMRAAGRPEAAGWERLEDVTRALAETVPVFKETAMMIPSADFRIAGQRIARQPHRYSGRTAMFANRTVHEPKPASDPDSPLAFTMEGFHGPAPAALVHEFWAPGWNSIQSVNKFQIEIAGPLQGGDPGRRLIEPADGASFSYFAEVPAAFERRDGQWLLTPLYHIFGSEPLSMFTPGLAELAPQHYLALNPADAEQLGLAEASRAAIELEGQEHHLPVKLVPSLPLGLAGLPMGLPGLPFIRLPRWSRLRPAGQTGGGS
jgi:NADH-quinone oxidoreductase subunit G